MLDITNKVYGRLTAIKPCGKDKIGKNLLEKENNNG